MTHQIVFASVAALGLVTACATPDVSAELKATTTAFEALKAATRPELEVQSKAELSAATEQMIKAKQLVLNTTGICQPVGALTDKRLTTVPEPCGLQSLVKVNSKTITATQIIAFETALDVYLKSLLALAGASSADEIETQSGKLIYAVAALADVQPSPTLTRLAQAATDEKDRLSGAAGTVADQLRHQALAKAIRRGDKRIQSAVIEIYKFYENQNPALSNAALAVSAAENRMTTQRSTGTVAGYAESIQDLQAAYQTFEKLAKTDPGTWYQKFAKAHSALHAHIQSGGNIEDLMQAIDALIALKPE